MDICYGKFHKSFKQNYILFTIIIIIVNKKQNKNKAEIRMNGKYILFTKKDTVQIYTATQANKHIQTHTYLYAYNLIHISSHIIAYVQYTYTYI